MVGQFLSEHVAVKQVEGKTFRPQRSSVTILYCNWRRPLRSKRLTFNLFYCYLFTQELPSHTFAQAMSLYQIIVPLLIYIPNARTHSSSPYVMQVVYVKLVIGLAELVTRLYCAFLIEISTSAQDWCVCVRVSRRTECVSTTTRLDTVVNEMAAAVLWHTLHRGWRSCSLVVNCVSWRLIAVHTRIPLRQRLNCRINAQHAPKWTWET